MKSIEAGFPFCDHRRRLRLGRHGVWNVALFLWRSRRDRSCGCLFAGHARRFFFALLRFPRRALVVGLLLRFFAGQAFLLGLALGFFARFALLCFCSVPLGLRTCFSGSALRVFLSETVGFRLRFRRTFCFCFLCRFLRRLCLREPLGFGGFLRGFGLREALGFDLGRFLFGGTLDGLELGEPIGVSASLRRALGLGTLFSGLLRSFCLRETIGFGFFLRRALGFCPRRPIGLCLLFRCALSLGARELLGLCLFLRRALSLGTRQLLGLCLFLRGALTLGTLFGCLLRSLGLGDTLGLELRCLLVRRLFRRFGLRQAVGFELRGFLFGGLLRGFDLRQAFCLGFFLRGAISVELRQAIGLGLFLRGPLGFELRGLLGFSFFLFAARSASAFAARSACSFAALSASAFSRAARSASAFAARSAFFGVGRLRDQHRVFASGGSFTLSRFPSVVMSVSSSFSKPMTTRAIAADAEP